MVLLTNFDPGEEPDDGDGANPRVWCSSSSDDDRNSDEKGDGGDVDEVASDDAELQDPLVESAHTVESILLSIISDNLALGGRVSSYSVTEVSLSRRGRSRGSFLGPQGCDAVAPGVAIMVAVNLVERNVHGCVTAIRHFVKALPVSSKCGDGSKKGDCVIRERSLAVYDRDLVLSKIRIVFFAACAV